MQKTLNPTWPDQVFRLTVLPKSLEIYKNIECFVFDYDKMSSDDPMGTVYVPIPVPSQYNRKFTRWFKVETGKGDTYCEDACGELCVEIEIIAK